MTRQKILVVDDDADDRELLSESMTQLSPQVEIAYAGNGLEALKYLQGLGRDRQHLPCLIVLDINMPLLDGKATFARLRDDRTLQQVPVIVLTSSGNPSDKEHFLRLGAEFYTKPEDTTYLKRLAGHMLSVCCGQRRPEA